MTYLRKYYIGMSCHEAIPFSSYHMFIRIPLVKIFETPSLLSPLHLYPPSIRSTLLKQSLLSPTLPLHFHFSSPEWSVLFSFFSRISRRRCLSLHSDYCECPSFSSQLNKPPPPPPPLSSPSKPHRQLRFAVCVRWARTYWRLGVSPSCMIILSTQKDQCLPTTSKSKLG